MTKYVPVFTGKTEDGERIVFYKGGEDELCVKRGDEALLTLSPGSEWATWTDEVGSIHLAVNSPEWAGNAVGFRINLFNEEV